VPNFDEGLFGDVSSFCQIWLASAHICLSYERSKNPLTDHQSEHNRWRCQAT